MGRKDDIIERVRKVAEPLAAQEGLELVDVQLGGAGRTELVLFIDKAPGAPAGPAANMPAVSDAHHGDDDSATSVHAPVVMPIDDADTVEAKPIEFIKHNPLDDDEAVELTEDDAVAEVAEDDDAAELVVESGPRKPGVSLDDCANFSRIVSAALDVEDPLDGAYELVVSSPGLDRPLRLPAHFEKYKGKRVRVRTYAPVPGAGERKNFVGQLLGFDAAKQAVLIDVDGTRFEVPHKAISKANLEPVFE